MKIVNVTSGDTGNQSYLLSRAINEHTEHCSRSFVRTAYFDMPYDVLWTDAWAKGVPQWIEDYWFDADIVHTHNSWKRKNYWAAAPKATWIVHQHGRGGKQDRYDVQLEVDEKRDAIRVVSTLNLMRYVDWRLDRWFPRPVEAVLPVKKDWNDKLHIIHCPTVPERKHTVEFVNVMERLIHNFNVSYEIVTDKPHSECMLRKAKADILFDQLELCYGTNSLEAWALGIPAIAGIDDAHDEFFRQHIGEPPYVKATTEAELEEVLIELIQNHQYRKHMAELGNEYVKQWHSQEKCAEIAIRTYKAAR